MLDIETRQPGRFHLGGSLLGRLGWKPILSRIAVRLVPCD